MENLGTRIKKSGKGFQEHGSKLLTETQEAGKQFWTFAQDEAKDWSGYLREQVQQLEKQGRELLVPTNPSERIWVHIDRLLAKVRRSEEADSSDLQEVAAESSDDSDEASGKVDVKTSDDVESEDSEETEEDVEE